MLTDLTDLSSCAAIGERLLKLWFEELDSLDQCPDVCTLNYMIDDLARMTAVHKSILHMTILANKFLTPPEGGTPNQSPLTESAPTPADPNPPSSTTTSTSTPGTPISRSDLSPSTDFRLSDPLLTDPTAIRSTNHDSRSTTYRAPAIRETGTLRDIPMLRDLTPAQIRVELDRMIPYLEERVAEVTPPEEPDFSAESKSVESESVESPESVESIDSNPSSPVADIPDDLPPFDPFHRSTPGPNKPHLFVDGERTRDPRCIALGIHPIMDTSRYPDGHPFFTDDRGQFRNRFPKPPKPKNRSR